MTKNHDYSEFPDIEKYSRQEGISTDILIEAFAVEKHYHDLLLKEEDFDRRMVLYNDFYSKVIPIYGRDNSLINDSNPKEKHVRLFEKELANASVIDFGCGQGFMLRSIDEQLAHKSLTGVDVVIPEALKGHTRINFIEDNIITHATDQQYDVAVSDNVVEHLVPEDAQLHLSTMFKALKPGGKLIILMPNRLFGPADVTRIKDFSHAGKLAAEGGHVNESTYTEMVARLQKVGFSDFKTVLPIPKLKYSLFRNVRIGTGWIKSIENSPWLLKFFRSIKIKGVCPVRFTVTLIASKEGN